MTWTLKKISPLLGNRVLGNVFICESFAAGVGFFLSVENCITLRLVVLGKICEVFYSIVLGFGGLFWFGFFCLVCCCFYVLASHI